MPRLRIPKIKPRHPENVLRAEKLLGYRFKDKGMLETALTHPSAAKHEEKSLNYERLEFLGDSVLSFIVAAELFDLFDDLHEGGLTRIKVSLVSGESLSAVAKSIGITDLIIFGDSEAGTNGRGLHSALENVYEALVAALYLDGGIKVARKWVLATLGPYINKNAAKEPESPKSVLQEYLQARHSKPEYEITAESGPPHERVFEAAVYAKGELLGTGSGHSKKSAETNAAQSALEKLEIC